MTDGVHQAALRPFLEVGQPPAAPEVHWSGITNDARMNDSTRPGDPALLAVLDALIDGFEGEVAVYARNLITGDELAIRAGAVMPTASVIKVAIMAALYDRFERDEIDPDERIVVGVADQAGGTGILKELTPGLALPLRDLCRLMIIVSDNTATALIVRRLGRDAINVWLRAQGYPATEVRMRDGLGGDIRDYAVSTAHELGRLMTAIATDMIVSPEACAAMRHHLSRQQHLEQIPRGLAFSPYLEEIGLAQPLRVMNKIGCYTGMRADAAIVEGPDLRFVLVTINEGNPDHGYGIDHPGNVLNGRIAAAVLDAWLPAEHQTAIRGALLRPASR